MDLEKIIKEKNSEIYKEYKYSKETWISVTNIKDFLKEKFDREGVAKKTCEKYHDNPSSEYYQKSATEIAEMWEAKAALSRENGNKVDTLVEMRFLNESEEKVQTYIRNCVNECQSMARKFIGVDACLRDFKDNGLNFECREIKLMLPFKFKKTAYVINGRFDAIFSKGEMLILVDWKNSEDIKTENRWRKLLGPCDKLDECDMNLFTVQLFLYIYMLKHVYDIKIPISCCIVQFPSQKDYYYKIYKPNFEYDEKLIEKIIKYCIEKKVAEEV